MGIEFKDVSFSYPGRRILEDLSFRTGWNARTGTITAIMGRSGIGKTTILRLVCGLESPSGGTITIGPPEGALGYIAQEPVIFEHLSVEENLGFFRTNGVLSSSFSEDALREAVDLLGLCDLPKSVNGLSGGERQRIALARSLATRPRILLLDEPCAGLDPSARSGFLKRLRVSAGRLGVSVLYVSHRVREAMMVADEMLFLGSDGAEQPVREVFSGKPHELRRVPPTLEVAETLYDGEFNRLDLSAKDAVPLLLEAGFLVRRGVGDNEIVTVTFPAEAVLESSGGLAVEESGRSDEMWYLSSAGQKAIILAPRRSEDPPTGIRIAAPVLVYDGAGRYVGGSGKS